MRRFLLSLLATLPLTVGSLAAADTRPPRDAFADAEAVPSRAILRGAARATVLSRDTQRGIPTMLFAPRDAPSSTSPSSAAREHLARHAARYGLPPALARRASVVAIHDIGRGGIVVTLRQTVDGVELFHHDVKVLMDRSLGLVAIGGALHASAMPSRRHGAFVLEERAALAMALGDLHDAPVAPVDLVATGDMPGGYRRFGLRASPAASALGLDVSLARIKRVYFPLPDRLVAAYFLELSSRRTSASALDSYAYVIAADDGRILSRSNLTHEAKDSYRVWADTTGDLRPLDGPLVDTTPYPADTPNGKYPATTAPSLVAIDGFNAPGDPWLPPGATDTVGNNVDAYTDDDAPDGFSENDTYAHVTSDSTFDRIYDVTKRPQASIDQRMASVTSLFYTTNWLHDWWYDSGFDEAGKNAQNDNYGRGGLPGDPLQAQAQNGAPKERNNSNMSVFEDGVSPRMQMFVWDGKITASLTAVGAPPDSAVGVAAFGPTNFDITGPAVLASDGVDPTNDVCEALTTDVTGKIAVVTRGLCPFQAKAQRVQDAGAIGIVVIDNKPAERAPAMGASGTSPSTSVVIPILSITQEAGASLSGQLAGKSLMLHMARSQAPDRDGTIDNTVVAHEWGHYLHLRHVSCGSAMCGAESEGWADFSALQMVVRAGDNLHGAFPLGQYATGAFPDDPAYFGIRRYPYSVDFTKNPLTFRLIADGESLPGTAPIAEDAAQNGNAEVHAAGEVWASMLFEGFVALLERSQGPSPAYTFDEARRRMSDYVVVGMTLAPTNPTFTEQRDALLAAALANDAVDLTTLAGAFARRGAGTCARSPARDSTDFTGVVEAFHVEPSATLESITVDDSVLSCDQDGHLDAGEIGQVTVVLRNDAITPLEGASATVRTTTAGASFPSGGKLVFSTIPPFGSQQASVQVTLDPSSPRRERLDLTVTVDAMMCNRSETLSALPLANFDDATTGATLDDVEAAATAWTLSGDSADFIWSRVEPSPGNKLWSAVDYPAPTDTSLVSPPLVVSASAPFVMTFTHRHQFETAMGVTFDGAVIEVSTDGGVTWQDISVFGDPGYPGVIGDPSGQSMNVLGGRSGYVDHNPSFPATDQVSIDMGTKLAGSTVQVRFRVGTDDAGGSLGWELDDIGFSGIDNAPFSQIIDSQVTCSGVGEAGGAAGAGGSGLDNNPPASDVPAAEVSGGSCAVVPGATSAAPLFLVVVAAAHLRKSRRRRVTQS